MYYHYSTALITNAFLNANAIHGAAGNVLLCIFQINGICSLVNNNSIVAIQK